MKYVFSKQVPIEMLHEFLESLCGQHDTQYVIDENVYRHMVFMGGHIPFLQTLKEYYLPSKHVYLTRELTYKSFTNILRQICRSHDYPFHTKMQYNHSQYNIMYFIQKPSILKNSSV